MDVYIGFGLLSAGVVIVVCMFFDGWLKRRNPRRSELQTQRLKDPEFAMHSDDDLPGNLIDNIDTISASYVTYDVSNKTNSSGLADLCEGDLEKKSVVENTQFDLGEEDVSPAVERIDQTPRKAHPQTIERTNEVLSATHERSKALPPNLLVLSVMAKKGSRFESYDLLQAISAAGMQFGEMNIFHYYQPTPVGKIALFSLASANKPGDFDMNNIAEFSCLGLMLFMDIGLTPDPQYAFKLMLETAERLAEDLDGELCADPLTVWNEKLAWQYHQKIMQFKVGLKQDNKAVV